MMNKLRYFDYVFLAMLAIPIGISLYNNDFGGVAYTPWLLGGLIGLFSLAVFRIIAIIYYIRKQALKNE